MFVYCDKLFNNYMLKCSLEFLKDNFVFLQTVLKIIS